MCDDGNKNDNQGCLYDCSGFITGWNCSAGSLFSSDFCLPICGDGIEVLTESCDDGINDNKGCLQDCLGINPKYECKTGNSPIN